MRPSSKTLTTVLPTNDHHIVKDSKRSAKTMEISVDNLGEAKRADFSASETVVVQLDKSQSVNTTGTPEAGVVAETPVKAACQSIAWDKDRVTEKNFLEILLEWLSDPDNYARWKSTRSSSTVTKKQLCHEIKLLLQAQGILHRKTGDIRTRIWSLERSLSKAKALLKKRGLMGLTSLEDCDLSIKCDVLQCCEHFQTLAPVMTTPTGQSSNILTEEEFTKDQAKARCDLPILSPVCTEEGQTADAELSLSSVDFEQAACAETERSLATVDTEADHGAPIALPVAAKRNGRVTTELSGPSERCDLPVIPAAEIEIIEIEEERGL